MSARPVAVGAATRWMACRAGGVDPTSVAADFADLVLDVEAMGGGAPAWARRGDYYENERRRRLYAGKAFLSADVARLVAAEGLGIDTVRRSVS